MDAFQDFCSLILIIINKRTNREEIISINLYHFCIELEMIYSLSFFFIIIKLKLKCATNGFNTARIRTRFPAVGSRIFRRRTVRRKKKKTEPNLT